MDSSCMLLSSFLLACLPAVTIMGAARKRQVRTLLVLLLHHIKGWFTSQKGSYYPSAYRKRCNLRFFILSNLWLLSIGLLSVI